MLLVKEAYLEKQIVVCFFYPKKLSFFPHRSQYGYTETEPRQQDGERRITALDGGGKQKPKAESRLTATVYTRSQSWLGEILNYGYEREE